MARFPKLSLLHGRGAQMDAGKFVFAQPMEFSLNPWNSWPGRVFNARWSSTMAIAMSSASVCTDQFLCMAVAQLTYRESLRDIEACLRAQATKLYHFGIRGAVSCSTLGDANESRDWRIYAELAQALMARARQLYASEPFALD